MHRYVLFGAIILAYVITAKSAWGNGDNVVYLPMIIAPQSSENPTHTGIATYYLDADGSGACLFDPIPGDLMVAAMNADEYDNAAVCGSYVEVNGPNGTVTVRIVDLCADCHTGHLDLRGCPIFEQQDLAIQGRLSPVSTRRATRCRV